MPTSTLYLIDDDAAVSRALEAVGDWLRMPVLSFSSAESFLKFDFANADGCLIIDIRLPGMTGLELQAALRERSCDLPVIIISGHADVPLAVEAMRLGALTVLEKPFSLDQLKTHIQEALELNRSCREQKQIREQARRRLALVTPREREVLDLIGRGLTNKQIAAQLHLTLRAIEDRRARLMRRVGAASLAELLTLVQQANLDELK
ncbi:MAG: LuxR family transcriptional regulator [Planctomycetota bacterium]|nr:MAG: LuxR family transcriptional regulator [Planctomycetota bacterium]